MDKNQYIPEDHRLYTFLHLGTPYLIFIFFLIMAILGALLIPANDSETRTTVPISETTGAANIPNDSVIP